MLHLDTIICSSYTSDMNEVPLLGNLSVATGCLWNKQLKLLTEVKNRQFTLSSGSTTQVRYTVYCILYTVYCILYTVYCILFTYFKKSGLFLRISGTNINHLDNIRWAVQIIKLIITQISPSSSYFHPLRPKYLPQHPFFQTPQPIQYLHVHCYTVVWIDTFPFQYNAFQTSFLTYHYHNIKHVLVPLGSVNINAYVEGSGLPGCFADVQVSSLETCQPGKQQRYGNLKFRSC